MGGYETSMGFFMSRGILWVQLQLFGFCTLQSSWE